jgi:hypothetical protein
MKSLPYTKHDLEILTYVFDGPVTFAYLAQKIHGFWGEYEIAGASNLIIWSDMSDEHSTAVLRLRRAQAIACEIVSRVRSEMRKPVRAGHFMFLRVIHSSTGRVPT